MGPEEIFYHTKIVSGHSTLLFFDSFGKNAVGPYNRRVESVKSSPFLALISGPHGLIRPWGRAFNLFLTRGGNTLAASVSFYTLLSVIPLLLLLVRMVGMWIKDLAVFKYHLFNMGKKLFPQMAPDLLNFAEQLVSAHLFASGKWTAFNLGILAFSALSMFNAIWNGVHWITQHGHKDTFIRYLKGFTLILLTIGLMVCVLTIPLLVKSMMNLLANNVVVENVVRTVPSLNEFHEWIKTFQMGRYFFFKSRLFSTTIILFYFTFLYRWFFPVKINIKYAFTAACTFVLLMICGRELFWVYLKFGKSGLVANYGSHYTLVLGIIWIFFLSSFFIYGICLMQAFLEKKQKLNLLIIDQPISKLLPEIPPIPTKDVSNDTNVD